VAAAAVGNPVRITVFPENGSQINFGDGTWVDVTADGSLSRTIDKDILVRVRNKCCSEQERVVKVGESEVRFDLNYKAAQVTPRCNAAGSVTVTVDRKPATLGEYTSIWFGNSLSVQREITVEFVLSDRVVTKEVRVTPGQAVEVTCAEP
jgi:hypothetical protein